MYAHIQYFPPSIHKGSIPHVKGFVATMYIDGKDIGHSYSKYDI